MFDLPVLVWDGKSRMPAGPANCNAQRRNAYWLLRTGAGDGASAQRWVLPISSMPACAVIQRDVRATQMSATGSIPAGESICFRSTGGPRAAGVR
jgi:hypothetical protein